MSEIAIDDEYDPARKDHRAYLAGVIHRLLAYAKFDRVDDGQHPWRETVYRIIVSTQNGGATRQVRVYTSIFGDQCRARGRDAIRCSGVLISGRQTHGLVKSTRVNRTGTFRAIRDRMLSRMRTVWKTTRDR